MSTAAPNNEKFVFEKRLYLEDSLPEVIQAMKDRVSVLVDDIIVLKELPMNSPFSVELLLSEVLVKKEQAGLDKFYFIVDVTECGRPSAEARRKINEMFVFISKDAKHISFVTGRSSLLNTVIRFVMFQSKLNSYTFDKGIEDALVSIRKSNNI